MTFSRRAFLGGLVATATMAEAGALAEFLDWIRRAPAFSIPAPHAIFGDGSTNEFTLAHEPLAGSCQVFLNGILMGEGRDFKLSGSIIRFEEAPSNADCLIVHSVTKDALGGLGFRAELLRHSPRLHVSAEFPKRV